jgi:hypothetical protein
MIVRKRGVRAARVVGDGLRSDGCLGLLPRSGWFGAREQTVAPNDRAERAVRAARVVGGWLTIRWVLGSAPADWVVLGAGAGRRTQ